jgi:hypothetical protein
MSYQGVLLDGLGQPRTGSVDLIVRLYDAALGGALLYKQSFPSVPLVDGVFSVELGPAGAASDVPSDPLTTSLAQALGGDLGATGPSRFVELTVGTEGTLARTQILAVPYALRAESASAADLAGDVTSVGGVGGPLLAELWNLSNLDGGGPTNGDPAEGTADPDGDLLPSYRDADNDDDGLSDAAEVGQGSDLDLITPTITGFNPPSADFDETTTVTVLGTNFDAGIAGVAFGTEAPTPISVSAESFQVSVGPQPLGNASVVVSLANGESDSALFPFIEPGPLIGTPHGVSTTGQTQLTLGIRGARQTVLSGRDQYSVDSDSNGVPDALFAFATAGGASTSGDTGQITVTWDPTGTLVGMRCRELGNGTCAVEYARDADADLDLADEAGAQIEVLGTNLRRL